MASAACRNRIATRRPCRSRSRRTRLHKRSRLPRPASALDGLLFEQFGKLRHIGLVGHVEPQRRDRDAALLERGKIGALRRLGEALAYISDPVIGITATVFALID